MYMQVAGIVSKCRVVSGAPTFCSLEFGNVILDRDLCKSCNNILSHKKATPKMQKNVEIAVPKNKCRDGCVKENRAYKHYTRKPSLHLFFKDNIVSQ